MSRLLLMALTFIEKRNFDLCLGQNTTSAPQKSERNFRLCHTAKLRFEYYFFLIFFEPN